MRSLLAFIPALLFSGLALAEPLHGISMHGTPALPADYKSFPYVNPDVKKGGRVSYGVVGTFDSLNPFIVKGLALSQIRGYVVESLLARGYDEPFTLYGLLAYCGLRIAQRAQGEYAKLVATGITCLVLAQATLNIFTVLGLAPLTGVPLPFISYGGSSLITYFAMFGIVQSVHMRRMR
jgi:hypothetical protein